MHRIFTQGIWIALLALVGSLLLFSSVVDGQSTPVTTEPPGPTNQPTATVPTTGVATGTAPATPLPTNGGNQTVVPTPTRPRPTRKPTDPLATLTVIKPPNRKDNPELYPIGSNIEFAWTIDTKNLLLPPDNITLDATPRSNPKEVYTIAVLPAGTTNFTWTAELQRNDSRPLIQDLYTLRIYDGQVGPYGFLTDGGGYLQSYVGLVFGLYFPRGYNNATCNCDSPYPEERCGRCEFEAVRNSAHRALSPMGTGWLFTAVAAFVGASISLF